MPLYQLSSSTILSIVPSLPSSSVPTIPGGMLLSWSDSGFMVASSLLLWTVSLIALEHSNQLPLEGRTLSTGNAALCLLTNCVKSEHALALLAFTSMFINVSVCNIHVSGCSIDATCCSLMGVIPVLYSCRAWTYDQHLQAHNI